MKNILLIKTGAQGDVLRTTVILEGLKEKYVNPKIYWLTAIDARPLLENNPFVEKVYYKEHLDSEILSRKYDLVISLEEDKEILNSLNKIKYLKWFGVYLEAEELKYTKRSETWYNMSLISKFGKPLADELKKSNLFSYPEMLYKMLGLNWQKQRYRLFLTKRDLTYASKFKKEKIKDKPVIGIVVGAGNRWPMKVMPPDQQIKLIKKIKKQYGNKIKIMLLTGPATLELAVASSIKEKFPNVLTHDIQNLEQFIGIVNLCDILICPDTLAMHIGIALTKYVVSYFTVTSAEEIELYTGVKVIAMHPDYCSYTKQNKKRPNIADKIFPDELFEHVKKLINT